MQRILVYWMFPSLALPCPWDHKTYVLGSNISMECGSSCTQYPHTNGWHSGCTQPGCSMSWMNGIPLYWCYSRFVKPCPCNHKKCGIGGNTSLSYIFSCNNQNYSEDEMVVFQVLPNVVPQFRCSIAQMNTIPVYWLYHSQPCRTLCMHP